MTPLFSTLLGSILLGTCIGSFLNVCLSRWKNGGNIFFPPSSQCPRCQKPILWFDNIPILSFVFLRAKCRFCRRPISWQYPIVEIITGFLFGLSFSCFHEWHLRIGSFLFVSFMVLLVTSDLKWKLLPHPFTNLFILTGLFFSKIESNFFSIKLFDAVVAFLLIGFVLYGTSQMIPDGLGGGDIKLGAGLAVWLGFSKFFIGLLFAFWLGSFLLLPFLFLKKVTNKTMIPFGPFLAISSSLLWFWPGLIDGLGVPE